MTHRESQSLHLGEPDVSTHVSHLASLTLIAEQIWQSTFPVAHSFTSKLEPGVDFIMLCASRTCSGVHRQASASRPCSVQSRASQTHVRSSQNLQVWSKTRITLCLGSATWHIVYTPRDMGGTVVMFVSNTAWNAPTWMHQLYLRQCR